MSTLSNTQRLPRPQTQFHGSITYSSLVLHSISHPPGPIHFRLPNKSISAFWKHSNHALTSYRIDVAIQYQSQSQSKTQSTWPSICLFPPFFHSSYTPVATNKREPLLSIQSLHRSHSSNQARNPRLVRNPPKKPYTNKEKTNTITTTLTSVRSQQHLDLRSFPSFPFPSLAPSLAPSLLLA